MESRVSLTEQERLLARMLEECMEEQLSFVPPEREIARMHRFSPEFLERMQELLRSQGRRKIEKHEFIYGFNKIAACVLVLLVVGGISLAGMSLFSTKGSMESAKAPLEEAAPMEEMKAESAEVTMEDAMEEAMEEETAEEPAMEKLPEITFLGQTLKAAPEQELPETAGLVELIPETLVLEPNTESLSFIVKNGEKHSLYYYEYLELEVLVDDIWYRLEPAEVPSEEERYQRVLLDGKTDRTHAVCLADYELDPRAEAYRAVLYMDGMTLGVPFTFEKEISGEENAE